MNLLLYSIRFCCVTQNISGSISNVGWNAVLGAVRALCHSLIKRQWSGIPTPVTVTVDNETGRKSAPFPFSLQTMTFEDQLYHCRAMQCFARSHQMVGLLHLGLPLLAIIRNHTAFSFLGQSHIENWKLHSKQHGSVPRTLFLWCFLFVSSEPGQ